MIMNIFYLLLLVVMTMFGLGGRLELHLSRRSTNAPPLACTTQEKEKTKNRRDCTDGDGYVIAEGINNSRTHGVEKMMEYGWMDGWMDIYIVAYMRYFVYHR